MVFELQELEGQKEEQINIINDFYQILNNPVIRIALITLMINQTIKLIIFYVTESALTMSVAVSIGFREGWKSSLFALAFIVTIIVMADAAGVRRATGEQAKVLNKIIIEFFNEIKIRDRRLREFIGHTPFEVIVGAVIGLIIATVISIYV